MHNSAILSNSPGATQTVQVTISGATADDLRGILRALLQDIDALNLPDGEKADLKKDAGYLDEKLESGKAKKGIVRECLSEVMSHLSKEAVAATATGAVGKAGEYLNQLQDYFAKHFQTG